MRFRITTAAVLVTLTSAACGASFDAELMVPFEARWQCDVQRSVYEDLDNLTGTFDERLAGNGLTAETYRDFKDALADDVELRTRVLAEYENYCNG